jgi:hypothetical protein
MLRSRFLLNVVAEDLVRFAETRWATHTEMLASYNTLMGPLRGLKKKVADLKNEAMQAEWEITQCKTIDSQGKEDRNERIKTNKTRIEELLAEFSETKTPIQTPVFENVFSTLAATMPSDASSLAMSIGTEMNELGVRASPQIIRNLRKIYFDDQEADNSEVFFKLIERPDKMVFVTGDAAKIQQDVLDVFENKGIKTFDNRTLDRKTVLPGNEPDHAKRLMESMKK